MDIYWRINSDILSNKLLDDEFVNLYMNGIFEISIPLNVKKKYLNSDDIFEFDDDSDYFIENNRVRVKYTNNDQIIQKTFFEMLPESLEELYLNDIYIPNLDMLPTSLNKLNIIVNNLDFVSLLSKNLKNLTHLAIKFDKKFIKKNINYLDLSKFNLTHLSLSDENFDKKNYEIIYPKKLIYLELGIFVKNLPIKIDTLKLIVNRNINLIAETQVNTLILDYYQKLDLSSDNFTKKLKIKKLIFYNSSNQYNNFKINLKPQKKDIIFKNFNKISTYPAYIKDVSFILSSFNENEKIKIPFELYHFDVY